MKKIININVRLSFIFFALLALLSLYSKSFSAIIDVKPSLTAADTTNEAQVAYQTALNLLISNKLNDAELAFKKAQKFPSVAANAGLGLVEIAFRRKKFETASKLMEQLALKYPESSSVLSSHARMLYKQQEYDFATKKLLKALTIEPGNFAYNIDLADIYLNGLQDNKKAIEFYTKASIIKPSHAGAIYSAGIAHLNLGNTETGLQKLETASRLDPSNPIPQTTLARYYLETKQLAKSNDALMKLLSQYPDYVQALTLKAKLELIAGKPEKALEYISRVDPKTNESLMIQAQIYHTLKKHKESKQAYQALLKIDPDNALAMNNLAWLLFENRQELNAAQALAKKAVALDPENTSYKDTLNQINGTLIK